MTTQTSEAVLSEAGSGPGRMRGQLFRFAVVGVLSGVIYLVLYVLARLALSAYLANLVALGLSAVANTELNRRFTFGMRRVDPADRMKHQIQGGIVFLVGLGFTDGGLLILHSLSAHPAQWLEIGVLTVANLAATVARFVAMRVWMFRH